MLRLFLTLVILFVSLCNSFSQIINTSFIAPDTVCVNQTFTVQNTSTGSINSTYWNFCSSSVALVQGVNLGTAAVSYPVFESIQNDAGTYYMFVTNNSPGSVSRFNFGNSLNNIPTSINLGNLGNQLPGNAEGIFIEKEGVNWFGVIVGGPTGEIVKLNFGTSLANTPTAINMGNIGNMSYPHRLQIIHAGGNKYGFTINRDNNTITRFDFGNSLSNTPTGTNLGNIGGLGGPNDIAFINYNGNWHAFITNDLNNTIARLDFGASLLNTPTGTNLGNPGFNAPRGISLDLTCGGLTGQLSTVGSSFYKLNFPSGPTGPITLTSIGNVASFNFPHSIEKFRINDTVYTFIPNGNGHNISRLKYASCVNLTMPSSTLTNIAPLTFTAAGVYTISLLNNSNQYNQSVYCKTIAVVSSSLNPVGTTSSICSGVSITLTATGATGYTWNPGSSVGGTVVVSPTVSTIYTVTTSGLSCSNQNTINIIVNPKPNVTASSNPTFICIGSSVGLSSSGASTYTWIPGNIVGQSISTTPTVTTNYIVTGKDIAGCTATAAIQVNVVTTLTLNISPSTPTICLGNFAELVVNGAGNYTWNPGSINTSTIIVSPNAVTVYTVVGALGTCSGIATTTLQVFSNPTITAISSSSTCIEPGSSSTITASGATTYSWSPVSLLTSSVIVTPSISTIYTVTGINEFGCPAANTLQINVYPNLSYSVSQYEICLGKTVALSAGGAVNYLWMPNNETSGDIVISPASSTMYTLTGTSGLCSKTTTFEIDVIQNYSADIPEVFTPNDDGKNDFFKIITQYPTKIKLSVFNRWGNLVYQNDEYDNSWNGSSSQKMQIGNGKLPEGTYYYIIEIDNCNHELVKGFVVIQY